MLAAMLAPLPLAEPADPAVDLDDGAPFGPFGSFDRAEPFRAGTLPRPFPLRFAPHAKRRRSVPHLPSEPALFPWLARRFAPGEATLWVGPRVALEPVLELLYAGVAVVRGRVSLLEGANRFHPYRIGELARSFGLDATRALARVRLARAFTAYQMVALVDRWATEAARHPPTLLIGHDLPALFADEEIPLEERTALLHHLARTLARLVRKVRLPLLLTLGPDGVAGFPGLAPQGPPWSDLVRFARGPSTLRLHALRDDQRLALVPRASGQRGIDDYGGGAAAEEVIAWDVPPRPTARRSRSG